jgi:hypothetical protein
MSRTTVNNSINLASISITSGTVYKFFPCNVGLAGSIAQGGTTAMNNGDSLLTGKQVQRGNNQTFQPFTISNSTSGCATRTYNYAISGANAADYQISPTSGTLIVGATSTPTLTFTPSGLGKRVATLTVTDDNGFSRSFPLAGVGTTRITWIGNIAQGGTALVKNGDTLLNGLKVTRKGSQTFTPITIQNFNPNVAQTPLALVTYTIIDPTGQYSVSPASILLGASQSSSPVITFNPTGVGLQQATLIVNAEGEIRTFILNAYSAAPGATFLTGGVSLGPQTGLYVNLTSCVGDVANTQAITINNIGDGNFLVNSINFYKTDTILRQGTPGYPLLRDASNNPIPMYDYFISLQPGVVPVSPSQFPPLPIVVPEKQSRTIYITYVGQYPGKRFARAFIGTNGQNFLGTDLSGNAVEGILNFDLFGRARGANLSDNPAGGLPKPIVFPTVRAGDSVDVTFSITNPGFCDLHLSKSQLRIVNGDVTEFRIISAFAGVATDSSSVRNDYVFAPGVSGTVTVRFSPSRSGSRRATMLLQTNDSTVYIPGVTERGAYYLDLFGQGTPGLEFSNVKLPDAVIDAAVNAGGSSSGMVELNNSSKEALSIANLSITGTNSSEFSQDPANPWPTLPTFILPGKPLSLSVLFTPTSASTPSMRTAQLDVTLSSGQSYSVPLSAYAGTRIILVTPTSLFDPNVAVAVGTLARRTVVITNTGTLNLTLQMPAVSGLDQADFQMGDFPRLMLAPGQMEFLELTYAPSKQGPSSATLDVMSDATNGKQQVQLTAKGGVTQQRHDGSQRVAGVAGSVSAAGVELQQSVPNPASGMAEIAYSISSRGSLELVLYDAAGKVVRQLERGMAEAGDHVARVDVSGLASGVYHYRLTANGTTLTREMTVVR